MKTEYETHLEHKELESAGNDGPHGVDRWTSNGYGLEIDGKKVIPLDGDTYLKEVIEASESGRVTLLARDLIED